MEEIRSFNTSAEASVLNDIFAEAKVIGGWEAYGQPRQWNVGERSKINFSRPGIVQHGAKFGDWTLKVPRAGSNFAFMPMGIDTRSTVLTDGAEVDMSKCFASYICRPDGTDIKPRILIPEEAILSRKN